MNPIEMMKSDHQTVRQIFNQLLSGGERDDRLLQQLRFELNTHAELEENIFYPACEKYNELKDLIRDAYKDHREVKARLMSMSTVGSSDIASIRQLMNMVETHVGEEEGQLFPLVQKVMPQFELDQIGQDMQHAKHQAGIRPRQTRTSIADY